MRSARTFALNQHAAFVKGGDMIVTMRCMIEIEGATLQVGDFATINDDRYRVLDVKLHHYLAFLKVTKMELRLVQEESAP